MSPSDRWIFIVAMLMFLGMVWFSGYLAGMAP